MFTPFLGDVRVLSDPSSPGKRAETLCKAPTLVLFGRAGGSGGFNQNGCNRFVERFRPAQEKTRL